MTLRAYLILFHFILLFFIGVAFLQTEVNTLHQQKYYDLLYYDTRFIAVVWIWTLNIYELCLYFCIGEIFAF